MQHGYTVGETAKLSGVSVRTLHHYEQIGLLVASSRSEAGYRLYNDADLERLTRVLYYRELGFDLSKIQELCDGSIDLADHLSQQHRMLTAKLDRLRNMINKLEYEMESHMKKLPLSPKEKLEVFGEDYDPAWEEEAKTRWGDTQAWQQSQKQSQHFTRNDWETVQKQHVQWNERAATLLQQSVSPTEEEALEHAESHRRLIEQHYPCSYAMHRQLADLYVNDPRFTAHYEAHAPGLAQWVRDAIHANADKHPEAQGERFH